MKKYTTPEIGGIVGIIAILAVSMMLCYNIILQITNFIMQLPVSSYQH